MSPGASRVAVWAALICAASTGACTPAEDELLVDVRTDFVAGVEFDEVVLRGGEQERREAVERTSPPGNWSLASGRVRMAHAAGTWDAEIALIHRGRELMARPFRVTVAGRTGVEVVLSRSCVALDCETSACLDGRCVAAGCLAGTEPECPADLGCVADVECGETAAACATRSCVGGVCLATLDEAACGTDSYCNPDRACEPLAPADAGPAGVDAGSLDAGVDAGPLDAGIDAGPLDAGGDAGPFDAAVEAGPFDAAVEAGPPTDAITIISPSPDGSYLHCLDIVWTTTLTEGAVVLSVIDTALGVLLTRSFPVTQGAFSTCLTSDCPECTARIELEDDPAVFAEVSGFDFTAD